MGKCTNVAKFVHSSGGCDGSGIDVVVEKRRDVVRLAEVEVFSQNAMDSSVTEFLPHRFHADLDSVFETMDPKTGLD